MDAGRILAGCGAMLEGHFLLSSGNHSDRYFQCARLTQFPQKARAVLAAPCGALLEAKKAGILDFDAVVGPALGGIIVAYEAARQLGVGGFFTERDSEGRMCLRRGFEVSPGLRVVIGEDVITTGKSTLETAAVLECAGAVITASICIVDRRPQSGEDSPAAENPPGGTAFAWPVFSALRQRAVIYPPDSCPLCKEGRLPLVKPGSRPAPGGRP